MASRFRGYKVGPDLDDAAELLAKAIGYPSGAALLKGLLRYAIACGGNHAVSLEWAKLSLADQDKLDAVLLWRRKKGKGMTAAQAAKWDWRKDYEAMIAEQRGGAQPSDK